MFLGCDFTYAGQSASEYGLYLCDIGNTRHTDQPFANKPRMIETRLANRVTPITHGVRYHDEPLTFPIIFGSNRPLDRYELQVISNWLMGYEEYQWLAIDQPDMENVVYRCLISDLTPISVRWTPYAFEAQVTCDCPYAYSYPFETIIEIDGKTDYRFYNDSSVHARLKPDVKVELPSGGDFAVINKTTEKEMRFGDLPAATVLRIDCQNSVVTMESGGDPYRAFNFQFLDLVSGDNELEFEGTGTVTISGRYLYNVGA